MSVPLSPRFALEITTMLTTTNASLLSGLAGTVDALKVASDAMATLRNALLDVEAKATMEAARVAGIASGLPVLPDLSGNPLAATLGLGVAGQAMAQVKDAMAGQIHALALLSAVAGSQAEATDNARAALLSTSTAPAPAHGGLSIPAPALAELEAIASEYNTTVEAMAEMTPIAATEPVGQEEEEVVAVAANSTEPLAQSSLFVPMGPTDSFLASDDAKVVNEAFHVEPDAVQEPALDGDQEAILEALSAPMNEAKLRAALKVGKGGMPLAVFQNALGRLREAGWVKKLNGKLSR
jgi:hypothetical protein